MSIHPPIHDGKLLSDEQKRLNVLFDDMKKNQLTFLDEASKRIIELSTGLLGLLFAVIALGKDFPPSYIKSAPLMQGIVVATLVAFVLAVLAGVLAVQPRNYNFYESNLTEMRNEFLKIIAYKSRWVNIANWLFFIGTLFLAVLVAMLVVLS